MTDFKRKSASQLEIGDIIITDGGEREVSKVDLSGVYAKIHYIGFETHSVESKTSPHLKVLSK